MKSLCFAITAALALSFAGIPAQLFAVPSVMPQPVREKGYLIPEFRPIGKQIQSKIAKGLNKPEDYADELKAWDALIDEHINDGTEDVAELMAQQMEFYMQMLSDPARALEVLKKIKKNLPNTAIGKQTDQMIESLNKTVERQATHDKLTVGTTLPDIQEKDMDGKLLSLSNYKGKVVLIDFWATWCRPCMMEMPNVIDAYEKFHNKGFEIVGITMERNPDKDRLATFLKTNKMPWPQYLDGTGFENKLADKYGIWSIPSNFLIDKEGRIIAVNLRQEDLPAAVAKALGI